MPVPNYQLLMLPVLNACSSGEVRISDAVRLIELTKRGHFIITERGLDVLRSNPGRVDNKLLSTFPEFKEFKDRTLEEEQGGMTISMDVNDSVEQTPTDVMLKAAAQLKATLAQELLDRVKAASPKFFELLIVDLLKAMKYERTANACRPMGQSGDDGVDGVINQDALGLEQVYIQAKRYLSDNVGPGDIRDFFGALDHKSGKRLVRHDLKFLIFGPQHR